MGIKFVLDSDEKTAIITNVEPYEADFGTVATCEHTIDAYIINDSDIVQPVKDSVHHTATGGNILVAIGDSITQGFADDNPSDDTSTDGRNAGG